MIIEKNVTNRYYPACVFFSLCVLVILCDIFLFHKVVQRLPQSSTKFSFV